MFGSFQREVSSVTDEIDLEKEISKKEQVKNKDTENDQS